MEITGQFTDFEGQPVVGVVSKLSGGSQQIARELRPGDRIIAVVEAVVTDVGHKSTKDGIKREHKLKVEDAFELPGKEGRKLLSQFRTATEHVLFDFDLQRISSDAVLDENGVALTNKEVAAMKGVDYPEPVVVIFEDGSRALWPDHWGKGVDLNENPRAGDVILKPNSKDEGKVIEIHDSITGEPIDFWTDEDEYLRLQRLEQEALEEERAQEGDEDL